MAVGAAAPGFFYVLEDQVRILFVDDDPIMREFAVVHLSSDKAEVTVGADGDAAIEAVAAADFDVVLLDLDMPAMDGFEVLARIRADHRTHRLPVIAVTGREDASAIDKAFEAGATSFLVKPINWRQLAYQVRYVHRAHQNEMGLLRERTRARAQADRASECVRRLASEGAGLLGVAMAGSPEMRRMARDYVRLLEQTAGAVKVEDEANP